MLKVKYKCQLNSYCIYVLVEYNHSYKENKWHYFLCNIVQTKVDIIAH